MAAAADGTNGDDLHLALLPPGYRHSPPEARSSASLTTAAPLGGGVVINRETPRQQSAPAPLPKAAFWSPPSTSPWDRQFTAPSQPNGNLSACDRRIAERKATMPVLLAPLMFSVPAVSFDDDIDSIGEGSDSLWMSEPERDGADAPCAMESQDARTVLAIGCFMSLAHGTSENAFMGSIGYFSMHFGDSSLLFYATVAQTITLPVVLDLQRRYDHRLDARFGLQATFLCRVCGLSVVQIGVLLLAPRVESAAAFLVLACVSAMLFSAVYAQVCMVVSCVDGPQAVNFCRTASHCGGAVVALMAHAFKVSARSGPATIVGFFGCAAAIQSVAAIAWFYEHVKSRSLSSAYSVIAYQRHRAAQVAEEEAAAEAARLAKAGAQTRGCNASGGYTLMSMFGGQSRLAGLALLGSFGAVQGAFSLIQSLLNTFGDEDLTQRLVLLMFVADMIGRIASHFFHGLTACNADRVPEVVFHVITAALVAVCGLLIADAWLRFLDVGALGIVVLTLCALTAFNINELAVKTIVLAISRAEVAHCQNYVFFGSTGLAKVFALLVQVLAGSL